VLAEFHRLSKRLMRELMTLALAIDDLNKGVRR
jgi:hypothetical protein